ncbi:MAG: PilZ domain-containing protein [Candidatus Omnitrophota bacterium]
MFKDSRRFQRLALNATVKFRQYLDYRNGTYSQQEPIEATAIDVSEGGMGIQAGISLPQNAFLRIWISLTGINNTGEVIFYGPIEALAKVRWAIPWQEKTFRFGISFLEMKEEDRQMLKGFINNNIKPREKVIRKIDQASGAVLPFDKDSLL